MKPRRKSRFWTFVFSFMPGAAEMYMGLMKMGLSLMSLFAATIFITTMLNIGPLIFIGMLSWFYSFFHARNIAAMDEESFEQLEDTYLFHLNGLAQKEGKQIWANQKVVAYTLIVIGIYLMWKALLHVCYVIMPYFFDYVFWKFEETVTRLVFGIVIVFLGLRLIHGRKKELLDGLKNEEEKETDNVAIVVEKAESVAHDLVVVKEESKGGRTQENANA